MVLVLTWSRSPKVLVVPNSGLGQVLVSVSVVLTTTRANRTAGSSFEESSVSHWYHWWQVRTFHRATVCQCQTRYLRVIQCSKSGACIGQQEVTAQDGHLVPKLHVLQRAVWNPPLLQIDYPTMHQERRVDQLSDLCQVPLARNQQKQGHI